MKTSPIYYSIFFLLAMSLSSSSLLVSSSSATEPVVPEYEEFLDPTETFQSPPPTNIPLGELLSEADFVALVYNVTGFGTQDCVSKVLRVKRLCAVRENWTNPGPIHPDVLYDTRGDEFVVAVGRIRADIFTHGEGFDNDAYRMPVIDKNVPHIYFGKVRQVTDEQAEDLQENLPDTALDGDHLISFEFEIHPRTPVRAVQGLRGVYPLYSLERMIAINDKLGFPGDSEELLRNITFKYLLQTYGEADAAPLVTAVNRLLEALALDPQPARQALSALSEDTDPVISAAATHLLALDKLPQFFFSAPVPLPVEDPGEPE